RMLDNLADDLFDLLAGAAKGFGQGGGGGTGWLSSIASLFTGKRASGGAVVRGQAYITGERRPEVFVPNTSGTIIPSVNAAMNRAQHVGGRPVQQSFTVNVNAQDAVLTETVRGWVQQGMVQ